ncbi:MAG: AzlD domain-containing protein [Firmicutes bacterium]|nr:AzlD domain-containing protein [Bacillota bacterium]
MTKTLVAVILMAVVTYIPRVFPIALYRRRIESRFFKSFLYYIPFAVLGAMTFPGILDSTSDFYSSLVGMMVALILAYFEQGLMKVALGAVLAVYLCELWF